MTELNRRALAKGVAWSIPSISVAAPAPAVAASPCADIVKGQPLPATAFTATYVQDANETLGGSLASKQLQLDFGFRVTAAAALCGASGAAITSSNNSGTSYARLSNGKTYTVTNGGNVTANGSVGATDTSCQNVADGTQACGSSGVSSYSVNYSSGTSGYYVTDVSIYRSVEVAGFGTTILYLNGSGFTGVGSSATALSATATPPLHT